MKDKELQKYMAGVLAMELHIYTLNGTINELTHQYNTLGRRSRIAVPQQKKAETSFFDCFIFSGVACGILVGLIDLFYEWSRCQNIFEGILSIIVAMFYAVGGLFVGGIVIGLISYTILRRKAQQKLDAEYQSNVKKYDADVKRQNDRIANEQAKQTALAREINALKTRRTQAQNTLSKAYAFNILAPEYRNIYAVSSMHGYLAKGRTHCLQFNEQTGDQGAYNLFENERRLDRVIMNTEEILERLDYVMQYQQDLATGLQDASRRIDTLCGNVNAQLGRITGSVSNIAQNQSIIAYNTECARKELEFMNWMHILR